MHDAMSETLFASPIAMEQVASCGAVPVAVVFNDYPKLDGKLIGSSSFGDLYEIDGRTGLLDYDGDKWILIARRSGAMTEHQSRAVRSIETAVEAGLKSELANFECKLKTRDAGTYGMSYVEREKYEGYVFRSYLESVSDEGRTYHVDDEDGTFEVLIPNNKYAPCECDCKCFRENMECIQSEFNEEDESVDPFECDHIRATDELDDDRRTRRVMREAAFEPCEYWN